jgi:hypothetical protein
MIMSGCAPKLNISIKIEATASTWREGEQPYDIYGAIKEKLEKVGFEVVPEESTDYDATLFINYKERKGNPYIDPGSGRTHGYGTDITCHLTLKDKAGNIIFETTISTATSYLTLGSLYESAVDNFEAQPYFEYLGEFIASKFGDARAVETLEALGLDEIGDAGEVEAAIQNLNDEDWSVRAEAAFFLGVIRHVRAVEALIQTLEDENSSVRYQAAWALGEIGDERAIEPLTQALQDEDEDVRTAAKEALEKNGWY